MTNKVTSIVNSFQSGFVFTPNDLGVEASRQPTVNRTLNNMVAAGKICRLSKGRFYKPRITQFGEFQPDTYIVDFLSETNRNEFSQLAFTKMPDERKEWRKSLQDKNSYPTNRVLAVNSKTIEIELGTQSEA